MSNNLLELLKEHLSGNVISNLAALIGETPNNTESALQSALPSLITGLVDQSGNTESIGRVFKILAEGNHDGGILSNLGALSRGGEETTKLVSQGGNLLASLFGDKVVAITDLVANAGGITKNASSSLLGFVTPVLLGLIGKRLKIENINSATGLAGFLDSQKGFLQDLLPAGLSSSSSPVESVAKTTTGPVTITENVMGGVDIVSLDDDTPIQEKPAAFNETLGNIGNKIEDVSEETALTAKHMAGEIGETAGQLGTMMANESKEFAHSAANAFEEGAGESKKFLPWVLIMAAVVLMWGLLKNCSNQETPTPEATTPATTMPITTAPEPMPATIPPAEPIAAAPKELAAVETPPPAAPTSDFFEKTLSSGYTIKAAKDGFESKLIGFIEGSEAISKDLWFTTDGIQFDTNKATIREESATQINDIAEILKAYPKVKIKIGGYTDNTGKANTNKKLSNNRAIAVKKAIVNKDIKADRMDAEGYGSEHPVAANDTEEGRQQNRRIDVRVTEK